MSLWGVLSRHLPRKNSPKPLTYGKKIPSRHIGVYVFFIRHNVEINKYYYIDESGRQVECLKTGKFPNKFMPNKTGHMGFKDRQGLAKTVWIRISLISKITYRTNRWHVRSLEASISMKICKKHITHHRMISSRDIISFPGQLLHHTRTNLMYAI